MLPRPTSTTAGIGVASFALIALDPGTHVCSQPRPSWSVPSSGVRISYPMKPGRTALAVDNLFKSFRLPTRRVDTLRERLLAGLSPATTELEVLRDVSFRVSRGEFLGIAGRNGSGKSTLLKLVAGIYRPDAGKIRAAGRLAPIIELGVGFNNELGAYDNVVMNAVMMGLEPSEARARYPEIIDFAELRDFEHLKLKNYSSGMRARLGFATMVHVDADLLLFDEVLAVGDAGFQEKCAETFQRLRESGRTGVLVTHSMEALQAPLRPGAAARGGQRARRREPGGGRAGVRVAARAAAGRPARQRERGAGMSEVSTRPLAVERAEAVLRERMARRRRSRCARSRGRRRSAGAGGASWTCSG